MHHQHPELDVLAARARYDQYVAEAAQDRLVREIRAGQISLLQRGSHRFGRSLVRLGAKLIRYSRVKRQSAGTLESAI